MTLDYSIKRVDKPTQRPATAQALEGLQTSCRIQ